MATPRNPIRRGTDVMTSLADQPDFARKLAEITEEAAGIILP